MLCHSDGDMCTKYVFNESVILFVCVAPVRVQHLINMDVTELSGCFPTINACRFNRTMDGKINNNVLISIHIYSKQACLLEVSLFTKQFCSVIFLLLESNWMKKYVSRYKIYSIFIHVLFLRLVIRKRESVGRKFYLHFRVSTEFFNISTGKACYMGSNSFITEEFIRLFGFRVFSRGVMLWTNPNTLVPSIMLRLPVAKVTCVLPSLNP